MRRARLTSIPIVATITVAWHAAMTVVAIVIDAPSQFGIRGTDPSSEWVTSGTAISAPPLPLVLLVAGALLARRRSGSLRMLGWLLVAACAVMFTIGGIGELAAHPTSQTSRAELVFGGVVALVFAAWLVACVARDARRWFSRRVG